MESFHFLRPYWLLALLPVLFLAWRGWHMVGSGGAWSRVCDAALLPHLLLQGEGQRSRGWILILGAAGFLTVVAMAGPVWRKVPQSLFHDPSALVVVFDLSASMHVADLSPDRLSRGRLKLEALLERRQGGLTALVVFAGEAFAVTPLTSDTDTIALQLKALDPSIMPSPGSRPLAGLEKGVAMLTRAGIRKGDLLLVTDGIDAETLRLGDTVAKGHRLSVWGVGTPQGGPIPTQDGLMRGPTGKVITVALEEEPLRILAERGGGIYLPLTPDERDLDHLMALFSQERDFSLEEVRKSAFQADLYQEEGPWLVLLAIPLAAMAFRRGLIFILLLGIILSSGQAQALEWKNRDMQGKEAFDRGDHQQAAELFTDPVWQGAARFRAGDYEGSLAQWEQDPTPRGHYNRGNALARLGRLKEALAAYEQALIGNPDDDDARYNRDLLKNLLEKEKEKKEGDDSEKKEAKKDDNGDNKEENEPDEGKNGLDKGQDGQTMTKNRPESGEDRKNKPANPQEQGEKQKPQAGAPQKKEPQGGTPQEKEPQGGTPQGDAPPKQEATNGTGQTYPPPLSSEQTEQQQADEQWLRRIPDDPGRLLRRKFLHQYRNMPRREGGMAPW